MSWIKLDDQFPTHPKIVAAGGDAAWLHVCALCYCGQHLTDGLVPKGMLDRISDRKNARKLAEKLIEVGAWADRGDSIEIHDYLDHNPSREKVLEERRKAAERRTRGGKSSAERRANVARTSPDESPNVFNPDPTPLEKKQKNSSPQADFLPTDAHCDYAKAHGLSLGDERDHWLDWCEANGRTYSNLNAGFSTWLRQAVAYGRGGAPVASIEDLAEPRMVLPPARVDTCPLCDSSLLACRCEERQTA